MEERDYNIQLKYTQTEPIPMNFIQFYFNWEFGQTLFMCVWFS